MDSFIKGLMLQQIGPRYAKYIGTDWEVRMYNIQKVSNIYKSNYVQAVQPKGRLDKYDTSSQNHQDQSRPKDFKAVLQKELEKQNAKKK